MVRRRIRDIKLTTDLVQVLIYLPAEVRNNLKLEAAERGLSMGIIVEEALSSRIGHIPRPETPT